MRVGMSMSSLYIWFIPSKFNSIRLNLSMLCSSIQASRSFFDSPDVGKSIKRPLKGIRIRVGLRLRRCIARIVPVRQVNLSWCSASKPISHIGLWYRSSLCLLSLKGWMGGKVGRPNCGVGWKILCFSCRKARHHFALQQCSPSVPAWLL